MKKIFLIALCIAATALVPAQPPTKSGANAKAEQEVRQMLDEYAKATKNINADALASMLTDDLIISNSDGTLGSKAKFMAAVRANVNQNQFDDYHYENIVIHVYGNVAAVHLIIASKGSTKNGPFDSRQHGTGMIVKQKGKWQAAAIHTSTIKQS